MSVYRFVYINTSVYAYHVDTCYEMSNNFDYRKNLVLIHGTDCLHTSNCMNLPAIANDVAKEKNIFDPYFSYR